MPMHLSVLTIEPVAADARRLALCLAGVAAWDVECHHQPDPALALRRLGRLHADLLFIDNAMPAVTGCEVIRAARALGETRPIIATARQDCGYLAADLMSAGADAFLHKRDLSPAFVQTVVSRALAGSRQRVAQVTLKREALRTMTKPKRQVAQAY